MKSNPSESWVSKRRRSVTMIRRTLRSCKPVRAAISFWVSPKSRNWITSKARGCSPATTSSQLCAEPPRGRGRHRLYLTRHVAVPSADV